MGNNIAPKLSIKAESAPNLIEKPWKEFQDAGLLWWVNRALHLFGWCIAFDIDEQTNEIVRVYPARTLFRGFCRQDEEWGFKTLSDHLQKNAATLAEETKL